MIFNMEEQSILRVFDRGNRKDTIEAILNDMKIIYDDDLKGECHKLALKIGELTEEEFERIRISSKEELGE